MTDYINDISNNKQMPYTVPDGFFDEMQQRVWEQVKQQQQTVMHVAVRKRKYWQLWTAAASVAILLTVGFIHHNKPTDMNDVQDAFAELSHEDQAFMLEAYSDDTFMQNY